MAICSRADAELNKFTEDSGGKVCVRVCADDPLPVTGTLTVAQATGFNIINHTTDATPGTETSIPLSTNAKSIQINNITKGFLQYSFVVAESGTKFGTIKGNANQEFVSMKLTAGTTLYVQSTKASKRIEIIETI